jgi:uncharacterized protein YjbI with pentapeptide repeats
MSSDSSGGIILKGNSLQIGEQIVIDSELNVNALSVNANQYKIGDQVVLDNSLNLSVNSLSVVEFNPISVTTNNVNALSVDANQYKISGATFVDNALNLNINNLNGSSITSNVVDSNQYKINGVSFIDQNLNLNVNSLRVSSFNPTSINTDNIDANSITTNSMTTNSITTNSMTTNNVISSVVNSNQYKINGTSFIDQDLNLTVNTLKASSFNPDKITTGVVSASSVVISNKTVIDTNKNISASNITSFNLDTSTISINGKSLVDKSRNINAGNVDILTLTQGDNTIIDSDGNMPNLMKLLVGFCLENNLVNYSNLDLSNLQLPENIFQNGILSNIDFTNTNLNNSNFSGALISNSNLTSAKLRNTNLRNAVFYNTNLHNVDMSGSDITHASFVNITDASGLILNGIIGSPTYPIGTKMEYGITYTIYQGCYGKQTNAGTITVDYNYYKSAIILSSGICNSFQDLGSLVTNLTNPNSDLTIVEKMVLFAQIGAVNGSTSANYNITYNFYPFGALWGFSDDTTTQPNTSIQGPPSASTFGMGFGHTNGFYKMAFMYGISPNFTFSSRNFSISMTYGPQPSPFTGQSSYVKPVTNNMLLHITS